MTPAPINHTLLAGGLIHLTMTGADGNTVSALVTDVALRLACWDILANVGPGENAWRGIAEPLAAARGVTIGQILGPSKARHISWARQEVCWTLMRVLDPCGRRRWTNAAIAGFLGLATISMRKGAMSHAARNGLAGEA
jgi:hypothetical protein